MNKQIYLILFLLFLFSCQNEKKNPPILENTLTKLNIEKHSKIELVQDFELLVNGLKEVHTGIYWYSTEKQFDSIVQHQKRQIKDSLNSLQFFNIITPIVAYTKEGHCYARLPEKVETKIEQIGKYLPFCVKSLNNDIYILNNYKKNKTKGLKIVSINGDSINNIINKLFKHIPSDGNNRSLKYRELDDDLFSSAYAINIEQPDYFDLELMDVSSKKKLNIKIQSVTSEKFYKECIKVWNTYPFNKKEVPLSLKLENHTAVLTLNTFSNRELSKDSINFKNFISSSFEKIITSKLKNLIIDIRKNSGGTEGNEDYLFSYLTNKPYQKYKYVEASVFDYNKYLRYTDSVDLKELETNLIREHKLDRKGRFLRINGVEKPEPLKENPFLGKVYILTSGNTYSGGAEFSTLMKQHTNAIFIGEEVGGGYFGNTSGYQLDLILPNTEIEIHIPILQFVLDVEKGIFGRGVIPDFKITQTIKEHLNGIDAEMEFTKSKID
jgi:hypothetical protein